MELDTLTFAYLCTVVLIANTVGATIGFGTGVISVTLGAQLVPIESLIPIVVPMNVVASGWIVARHWRHINRKELFQRILPVSATGMALGYMLFTLAPGRSLEIVFGVFVVVVASWELIKVLKHADAVNPPLRPVASFVWLFSGGIAQGLYTSGGPMIVYYASRTITEKSEFRATITTLWLILCLALSITHWFGGQSSASSLAVSGYLLLPLAAGVALGEFLHYKIPQQKFRQIVMALLVCAGASLLLK